MVVNSYRPRWVKLDADGRELVALTFVVRRDHPQYAGKLSPAEQADVLASAAGAFGSSLDYLERTRVALVSHGIVDPYLEHLAASVAARRRAAPVI
jgi:cation transport protein ChaC